jgi:hypothetical protein
MAVVSNGTTMADAGAFSASLGSMVHIKTLTASSSATLSFVHGSASVVLDSTYPIYLFKFINIHPATDATLFQMNGSIDAGSNYNVTKTTTVWYAIHRESETTPVLSYDAGSDLAQSTAFSRIVGAGNTGNDNDQCCAGEMWLFNPSSTTYIKHFIATGLTIADSDYQAPGYIAGYFNDTNDVDAIQFKMNSGNIDSGTIKLYGIKDS